MSMWIDPFPDEIYEEWCSDLYGFPRETLRIEVKKYLQCLYLGNLNEECIRWVCWPELEKLDFYLERQRKAPSSPPSDPYWITTHRVKLSMKGYTKWKRLIDKYGNDTKSGD